MKSPTIPPSSRPEDAPTASEFAAAAAKNRARAASLRAQAEAAGPYLAETYRRRAAELELAAFAQQVRAEANGYRPEQPNIAA